MPGDVVVPSRSWIYHIVQEWGVQQKELRWRGSIQRVSPFLLRHSRSSHSQQRRRILEDVHEHKGIRQEIYRSLHCPYQHVALFSADLPRRVMLSQLDVHHKFVTYEALLEKRLNEVVVGGSPRLSRL
jgi:hypothetical protein